MSDTDIPWSAKAKLGEVVARSRIGKSANHIVGDLSTTLDQESSEGKSGTLGWTKGDCVHMCMCMCMCMCLSELVTDSDVRMCICIRTVMLISLSYAILRQ